MNLAICQLQCVTHLRDQDLDNARPVRLLDRDGHLNLATTALVHLMRFMLNINGVRATLKAKNKFL